MSSQDTSFTARVTKITSSWAQAINDWIFKGRNPLYVTSTGTGTAYVVTLPATSLYSSYSEGDTFTFKAHAANTGAATLTIVGASTLTAKNVYLGGVALSGGEIGIGDVVTVKYDGTRFQLQSAGRVAVEHIADTAGAHASSAITFTQSGIGDSSHRASRTVEAKVGEAWVSVKDAKNSSGTAVQGDGSTDDVSGIQRAIDAVSSAGGGVVFFPEGTYKITAQGTTYALSVPSNVVLRGAGMGCTTIKLSGNPVVEVFVVKTANAATRAAIFDLTVDCDKTNNTTSHYGVYLDAATKCTVERVRVTNSKLHGIFLNGASTDNTVKNCVVDAWGDSSSGAAIVVYNGGLRNRIEGNTCDGTGQSNSGILIDASSTGGGGTAANYNDVIGNTVLGTATGITIEDSHGCVVVDNKIIGHSGDGILIQEGQDTDPPQGTIVRGNRISAGARGIWDGGIGSEISENHCAAQTSIAIIVQEKDTDRLVYGSRVFGNHIRAMNSGAICISLRGLACLVAGNFLYNVGTVTYGIKVASGATTSDNQIRNNHFSTGTYTAAIYAEEGSRLTIAGNRLLGITVTNGIQITDGVTSYHEDDNEGSLTSGTFRSIHSTPTRLAFTNDAFGVGGNPKFTGHIHGRLCFGVPNSAPTDANMSNGQISFYLNAGETALNARIRKSDGNYASLASAISIA